MSSQAVKASPQLAPLGLDTLALLLLIWGRYGFRGAAVQGQSHFGIAHRESHRLPGDGNIRNQS
jgi:hypothetical protein